MIPLLLWQSNFPVPVNLAVMLGIELAFNVFPATAWSSLMLQGAHFLLFIGIFTAKLPYNDDESSDKSKVNQAKKTVASTGVKSD